MLPFDPGVTAIVGPNGCGKSNVSDAVRWVLGEQSPAAAARRQDGRRDLPGVGGAAAGERRRGVARLRQHRRRAADRLSRRWCITRRLSRSGESDYLLNRSPSRLRDIQDLLRGTGLGADAGVVIEARDDRRAALRPRRRTARAVRGGGRRSASTATASGAPSAGSRRRRRTSRGSSDLIARSADRRCAACRGSAARPSATARSTERRFSWSLTLARRDVAELDRALARLGGRRAAHRRELPEARRSAEDRRRGRARGRAARRRGSAEARRVGELAPVGEHAGRTTWRLESELRVAEERQRNASARRERAEARAPRRRGRSRERGPRRGAAVAERDSRPCEAELEAAARALGERQAAEEQARIQVARLRTTFEDASALQRQARERAAALDGDREQRSTASVANCARRAAAAAAEHAQHAGGPAPPPAELKRRRRTWRARRAERLGPAAATCRPRAARARRGAGARGAPARRTGGPTEEALAQTDGAAGTRSSSSSAIGWASRPPPRACSRTARRFGGRDPRPARRLRAGARATPRLRPSTCWATGCTRCVVRGPARRATRSAAGTAKREPGPLLLLPARSRPERRDGPRRARGARRARAARAARWVQALLAGARPFAPPADAHRPRQRRRVPARRPGAPAARSAGAPSSRRSATTRSAPREERSPSRPRPARPPGGSSRRSASAGRRRGGRDGSQAEERRAAAEADDARRRVARLERDARDASAARWSGCRRASTGGAAAARRGGRRPARRRIWRSCKRRRPARRAERARLTELEAEHEAARERRVHWQVEDAQVAARLAAALERERPRHDGHPG